MKNPINSQISVVSCAKAGSIMIASLVVLLAITAGAADIHWTGPTADYTNTAYWDAGRVPSSSDNAINDNSTNNVVQISAGNPDWTVNDVRIGNSTGDGAFVQNGQALTVNGWLRLGVATNRTGIYTLNDGTVTLTAPHGQLNVGELGTGFMNINGGQITCSGSGGFFYVSPPGGNSAGTDVVNQVGGTITMNGQLVVGNGSGTAGTGYGIYNFSGGTNMINNYVAIGRQGGNGKFIMTGGVLNQVNSAANFLVGTAFSVTDATGSVGELDQSGGTINVSGQFRVPESSSPSIGTYNMSGGALNVNNWLYIGGSGGKGTGFGGTLNLTNGSITVTGTTTEHLDIGGSSSATLNQYGGTITSLISDSWLGDSSASTATWNFNGGTAQLRNLVFCQSSLATALLYFNGGLLQVSGITAANSSAYSGIELNGGAIQANANNESFISGISEVLMGPDGVTIDSQSYDITIPQQIDDYGGGLTKTGSGTLTLSGLANYSGPTLVNAGTLVVGTGISASGNITAADGAAFGVLVQSANAQYHASSLILGNSAGASLDFNLANYGNPTVAPLEADTLAANGIITINVSDTLPQLGQFPLVHYNTLGGSENFQLGTIPDGITASLVNNTANHSIDLLISSVALPRWDGQAGGDWDIGLTENWVNSADGTPAFYQDGNSVLFDDDALGTTTVNLTTAVHPSAVVFNNSLLPYTLNGSGKISGPNGVLKKGTNTLSILTAGNDYAGPTVISGGTLLITNLANGGLASSIGASSSNPTNLVIQSGTLKYTGAPVSINRGFMINGTNSAIDAESDMTLSGAVTVSSALTSSNSFIKTGPAQLSLTGTNDNEFSWNSSPGVRVVTGTLLLDGSAGGQTNHTPSEFWIGSTPASGASLIVSNTTLNVDSYLDVGRGNGTNGNISTLAIYNSQVTVGNLDLGYDAGIASNRTTQILTLNGNSTLTSLGLANLADSGGSTATVNINGTSTLSAQTKLVLAGAGTGSSTGTMTVADSGKVIVHAGYLSIGSQSNSVASLTVKDNGSISVSSDFNVCDAGAPTATVLLQDNASVNANNFDLVKGSGASGTVTITNNAAVNLSADLIIGRLWDGTPEAPASAVVNLSGGTLTANSIQGTLASNVPCGIVNFNGGKLISRSQTGTNFMFNLTAINILAGGAIIDSAANTISIAQPLLDGGGNGGLTKLGAGKLYLNGANTYIGPTLVSAGTLAGAGSVAGPVTVASGATLAAGAGSIGVLTVNNTLTLSAGSTTYLKLGSSTNDEIVGLTGVSYGGTLIVTNITGAPFADGTIFKLFDSTTVGSGNFVSVTILSSGAGTFNPATGELTIGATAQNPTFNPVTVSGGNLILSGAGTAGTSYTLLTTTNLAMPMALWATNYTGTISESGTFTNSIPMSNTNPARYFRVRTP